MVFVFVAVNAMVIKRVVRASRIILACGAAVLASTEILASAMGVVEQESEKMPVDWSKYPPNWKTEIAPSIKEAAGWKCEKCGKQCRFPDEPLDTHKRTLTVAHINHVEMDCRPENLVALCPKCHLQYDGYRKALQRLAKKRIAKSEKQPLFEVAK